MKPMASGAIVQNKIATPKECLTYALTLPTSAVITGIESLDVLDQDLEIIKNFKPLDGPDRCANCWPGPKIRPERRLRKVQDRHPVRRYGPPSWWLG